MLDDDDLPNSELLLDEGGRDRPRRYCCEKHAWRALGRVADLAEAHRDMCCREVELALDRCSTFSPSHDELRDFVGTLLERRAVVERNGQPGATPWPIKSVVGEEWRVTGGRHVEKHQAWPQRARRSTRLDGVGWISGARDGVPSSSEATAVEKPRHRQASARWRVT